MRNKTYRPTALDMSDTSKFQKLSSREGGKFDNTRTTKQAVGTKPALPSTESAQTTA